MRVLLAALAVAALTAGCGSSSGQRQRDTSKPGSLEALWRGSGQGVSLIPGTQDYAPGDVRFSFLIVDPKARAIDTPKARIWIAKTRQDKPFQATAAHLQPVGVPGSSTDEGNVHALYVVHFRIRAPGTYYVVARPIGGPRIGGISDLIVRATPTSPAVGSKAYPSRTPTLASTGGRVSALTTRVPPDRQLLRYSVADSLAKHIPFVIVFATPRYCSSRTCGPVVDVVDVVRRRLGRSPIRFIHVEVYEGNNPQKGYNRWMRQWHLETEPWAFVVGRDGRIKARFEGSFSVAELEAAVRRFLG